MMMMPTARQLGGVIIGFIVLELVCLGFIINTISSSSSTENSTNDFIHNLFKMSPSAARRKFIRFLDPRFRQRRHKKHLDHQSFSTTTNKPFHHSQMATTRRISSGSRGQKPKNNNRINNQTTPLDDYYKRRHITITQSQQQAGATPPPILVVGGSDGSGTRMFVQLLLNELGVPMIVDNWDTMDVHGEEMTFGSLENPSIVVQRGWPPLVQKILREIPKQPNTLNYTLQSLSKTTQQQVTKALLQLKSSLIQKEKHANKERRNRYNPVAPAALVQYGFKAPITMVLLPLLQQVFGGAGIKFLHVIRDGRDVALSKNQSPVDKFYDAYYNHSHFGGLATARLQQHASIQLWNDWNSQLYNWARQRVVEEQTQRPPADDNDTSDQQTFDYMVLRTEDLLDDKTRLEALVQLAEFVGAKITPKQLCCLSQRGILQDLGQSGQQRLPGGGKDFHFSQNVMRGALSGEQQAVKTRYGKWREALKDQPDVLKMLQETGEDALRLFGYEPPRRFLDQSSQDGVQHDFQCDDEKKIECDF